MRRIGPARVLLWGPVALALMMLALTLIPAEVWKAPKTDATYTGFDPNLVSVTGSAPGSVQVSASSIDLTAAPNSQPTVNLATTQLQKFNASVDVVIASNTGSAPPFRIGVWSPWTLSGQFVLFGAAPGNVIRAETLTDGTGGPP